MEYQIIYFYLFTINHEFWRIPLEIDLDYKKVILVFIKYDFLAPKYDFNIL